MKGRPEPYDTLGWAYYRQGQTARALSSFERALALSPDNPTYRYHVGLAYLKLGDVARGRAALTRAIELKPQSPAAQDARRALSEVTADR
jgi:Flp pilus assembly protein TadD